MKKIFILKRENIFPDLSIFKRINDFLWKRLIEKEIEKSKNDGKTIISDINIQELKNFADYVDKKKVEFKPYYEYIDGVNFARKILALPDLNKIEDFDKIKKVIFAWFTYFLIPKLQDINIIEAIIKENPDNVAYFKIGIFGRIVSEICKINSIKTTEINSWIFKFHSLFNALRNRFEILLRFSNFKSIKRREFSKTNNKPSDKSVIIASFDGYYSDRLSSIYKTLKKEDFSVLIRDFSLIASLEKEGIYYNSFGDFLSEKDIQEIKKKAHSIFEIVKEITKDEIMYHDINIINILKDDLIFAIYNDIIYALYYTRAVENITKHKQRLIVISDNVIIPDSVIATVVKENNSKSLVIQNGIYSDPTGRGILPIISDKIAIWGNAVKEYSKEIKEKGVITGNIRFDKYKKIPKISNNKYIILATQAFDGYSALKEKKLMLKASISAIKNFPGKKLIIKSHPRDDVKWILNYISDSEVKNVILDKNTPTEELLPYCEALITTNSTLMLDAMILKKPVINLNLINRSEILNHVKSGAVIGVYKEENLTSAIKKINDLEFVENMNKKANKFLKEYCYKIDGNSAERVGQLIKKMTIKND